MRLSSQGIKLWHIKTFLLIKEMSAWLFSLFCPSFELKYYDILPKIKTIHFERSIISKHATNLCYLIFSLVYFHSVNYEFSLFYAYIIVFWNLFVSIKSILKRIPFTFSHYCKVNSLWKYLFSNILKEYLYDSSGQYGLGGGFWNKIIFIHGNICTNISFY